MSGHSNAGEPPENEVAPHHSEVEQNEANESTQTIVHSLGENNPPTTGPEFGQWWIDNIGPITITHLHPEDQTVKDRARKEKRELTDDERQMLFMQYGNSRTFPRRQEKGAAWLLHNADGFNTYFQAATFPQEREKPNTKPGKSKCESVACVWADIDPPTDCGDLDAWRRKQVAALDDHPVLPPAAHRDQQRQRRTTGLAARRAIRDQRRAGAVEGLRAHEPRRRGTVRGRRQQYVGRGAADPASVHQELAGRPQARKGSSAMRSGHPAVAGRSATSVHRRPAEAGSAAETGAGNVACPSSWRPGSGRPYVRPERQGVRAAPPAAARWPCGMGRSARGSTSYTRADHARRRTIVRRRRRPLVRVRGCRSADRRADRTDQRAGTERDVRGRPPRSLVPGHRQQRGGGIVRVLCDQGRHETGARRRDPDARAVPDQSALPIHVKPGPGGAALRRARDLTGAGDETGGPGAASWARRRRVRQGDGANSRGERILPARRPDGSAQRATAIRPEEARGDHSRAGLRKFLGLRRRGHRRAARLATATQRRRDSAGLAIRQVMPARRERSDRRAVAEPGRVVQVGLPRRRDRVRRSPAGDRARRSKAATRSAV